MTNRIRSIALIVAMLLLVCAPAFGQAVSSQIRQPSRSSGTPTAGYRIFSKQALSTVGWQLEAASTSDLLDIFCNGTLCVFKTSGDALRLTPGGTNGWDVGTAWHLTPTADNTYDVGDATHAIRDLYIGTYNSGIGNFTTFTPTRTASAGTWTLGTVATARYTVTDKEMTVLIFISGSSVSATPANLMIDIPGGFTSAFDLMESLNLSDNGTGKTGTKRVVAGDTKIYLYTAPATGGTWATSTTATAVYFSFTFEIN